MDDTWGHPHDLGNPQTVIPNEPLAIEHSHSYWKWPFIVDLPIKNWLGFKTHWFRFLLDVFIGGLRFDMVWWLRGRWLGKGFSLACFVQQHSRNAFHLLSESGSAACPNRVSKRFGSGFFWACFLVASKRFRSGPPVCFRLAPASTAVSSKDK